MTALKHQIETSQALWELLVKHKYAYLAAKPRFGKALANSELVLTPNGYVKMDTLQKGDLVIGSNGNNISITGVFPQGTREIYKTVFVDGTSVMCDKEHLWTVHDRVGRKWKTLTTTKLMETGLQTGETKKGSRKHCRFSIPLMKPANIGKDKEYIIKPYLLGLLLGDGSFASKTPCFTNSSEKLFNIVTGMLPNGVEARSKKFKQGAWVSTLSSSTSENVLTNELKRLGLQGHLSVTKFIPNEYLQGSLTTRKAIVKGLLETDGTKHRTIPNAYQEFNTSSKQLKEDFIFLARSIGMFVIEGKVKEKPTYNYKGEIKTGQPAYRVSIITQSKRKNIESITFSHKEKATCISVNSKDSLFVTNGFNLTHNSLTVLLTIENSKRIKNVLILCPKNAIAGWDKFTTDTELLNGTLTKNYTTLNYEALGRFKDRTHSKQGKKLKKPISELHLKVNPDDFDLVVLDESHRLGKLGKPSQRYLIVKAVVGDKPTINLSGTAIVESPCAIYYQMSTSTHTPFPQKSFYEFHDEFGLKLMKNIGRGRDVNDYSKGKPTLMPYIDSFTLYRTQEDAGISKDIQSTVKKHYVNLTSYTKTMYNKLQTDRVLTIGKRQLIADSILKLRLSLHQIESSCLKIDDEYIELDQHEKVNYIKNNFKVTKDTVILAYYIAEQKLLKKQFPHATVDSATSKAEGVDFSHADNFILYSTGYSGAKYIQLLERIVNLKGSNTYDVHLLLVKNAISDQVVETVEKKADFNNSCYIKRDLN